MVAASAARGDKQPASAARVDKQPASAATVGVAAALSPIGARRFGFGLGFGFGFVLGPY